MNSSQPRGTQANSRQASPTSSLKSFQAVRRGSFTRLLRRFSAVLINHAVDSAHFIDNPVRHLAEQAVRQLGPVRVMKSWVWTRHGCDNEFVSTAITHDADGFDREKYRKRLSDLVVPIRCAGLVDEDGVSAAQRVGVLLLDLAEDAYPKPGPRNGWR